MKKLLFVFLIATGLIYAQACPGGFWGNGQCIGACESPLVNPNVRLSFYNFSCVGTGRQICTDGGVFCFPEYSAYDMAYGGQYCGVVTDYGAGECTFPYLYFNQQAPKRQDNLLPDFSPAFLKLTIGMKRPVEFKITPIKKVILYKNRFWWRRHV